MDEQKTGCWQTLLTTWACLATIVAFITMFAVFEEAAEYDRHASEDFRAHEQRPGWVCLGESVWESKEQATNPSDNWCLCRVKGGIYDAVPFTRTDCLWYTGRGVKWILYAKLETPNQQVAAKGDR